MFDTLSRLVIWLLLLVSSAAWAHTDHAQAGGFLAGMLHPVGGFDHVLAMIAVGLWGAQLGNPARWALPIAFPLVMAFGGFLGLIGIGVPGVEFGIAVSAIVLGIAVLLAVRPPLWLATLMVGLFAIFHGHAHGTELPDGASGLAYSAGFMLCTGLLHLTGIGLGMINRLPRGASAIRGLGALIGAGGIYFLGLAFAG